MPFALVCCQLRFCFVLYICFFSLAFMLLLFAFLGRQPGWPYGLSGSRPLRDFLLALILYASLENKFFFFFFFLITIKMEKRNIKKPKHILNIFRHNRNYINS